MSELLLLIHLAATMVMVGLIWFVQIVHYPLFDGVGGGFPAYEARHTVATTRMIALPALTEALAAGLLAVFRPASVPLWMPWTAGTLLAAVWVVTLVVHVPAHRRLGEAFDAAVHRRLVSVNWIRTAAWTARGGLAAAMVAVVLEPVS